MALGLEKVLDELKRQNYGNIHYTGHIVNKSDAEVISIKSSHRRRSYSQLPSTVKCFGSSRIKGLDHVLGSLHELKKHSSASHRKFAVALITVFGNGRQRESEFTAWDSFYEPWKESSDGSSVRKASKT